MLKKLNQQLPTSKLLNFFFTSSGQRWKFALLIGVLTMVLAWVITTFQPINLDAAAWIIGLIGLSYTLITGAILELSFHPITQKIPFIAQKTWWRYYLITLAIFVLGNSLFMFSAILIFPLLDADFSFFTLTPVFTFFTWDSYLRFTPFWFIFALVIAKSLNQVETENKMLYLELGQESRKIMPEKIISASNEQHYLRITLAAEEELFIRMNLVDLQQALPKTGFIQIHRSYLVNLSHATSLRKNETNWEVVMKNGQVFPVSRRKLQEVKKAWAASL